MEIPSNMPMGQAIFKSLVSLSVQKMSMESAEQSADALRQMMERSLMPHLGGGFDMKG